MHFPIADTILLLVLSKEQLVFGKSIYKNASLLPLIHVIKPFALLLGILKKMVNSPIVIRLVNLEQLKISSVKQISPKAISKPRSYKYFIIIIYLFNEQKHPFIQNHYLHELRKNHNTTNITIKIKE